MKKLFFIVITVLAVATATAMAADKEPVKYQVNFEIQYNAVTKDQAVEIYERVLRQNKTACKVKITTKKASDADTVVLNFIAPPDQDMGWADSGAGVVTLENTVN